MNDDCRDKGHMPGYLWFWKIQTERPPVTELFLQVKKLSPRRAGLISTLIATLRFFRYL